MANATTASNVAGPSHGVNGIPSARSRRMVLQEEDATKLQFGEFADGEALTITETQELLTAARLVPGVPAAPDNKVYKSTIEYVNEFSNASMEASEAMRAALTNTAKPGFLNKFEIAQLMYLRPERVEVAVALIPSLERYAQGDEDEEILKDLLKDIRQSLVYGK